MRLSVVQNCHAPSEQHNPGGCPFSRDAPHTAMHTAIRCGHPRRAGNGSFGDVVDLDRRGCVLPPDWCPLREGPDFVSINAVSVEHGMALHLKEVRDALRWVAQTVHQAYHRNEGPIESCPRNTCDHAMKMLGKKT